MRLRSKFNGFRLGHAVQHCAVLEKPNQPKYRLSPEQLELKAAERWFDSYRAEIIRRKKDKAVNRRQEREKAALGWNTDAEFALLVWLFQNRCAYCWEKYESLTRDHVIPLLHGGSHSIENILPACHRCNSKKGGRLY